MGISVDEIDRASKKASIGGKKKQAYRPPTASTSEGNMVSQMMKGDIKPLEDRLDDLLAQLGNRGGADQASGPPLPTLQPEKPQQEKPQRDFDRLQQNTAS